jgi:hypothetical protein
LASVQPVIEGDGIEDWYDQVKNAAPNTNNPQKNGGQKNEDRTPFHGYFSARHFSAFCGLPG